jgi:hypothetical protein
MSLQSVFRFTFTLNANWNYMVEFAIRAPMELSTVYTHPQVQ